MIRINKKCLEFENSKILFSIIQSRHSKVTKYRVYCKYNPSIISADSIEWWYCTWKSGERLVLHTRRKIIYYFAYAQFLAEIPDPAGELLSIFAYNSNADDGSESADNEPSYTNKKPNKRKTNQLKS